MKKIGILANYRRDDEAVRKNIVELLERKGAELVFPQGDYDVTDAEFLKSFLSENSSRCDCLIVLGGDGTILSVARCAAGYGVPIFGINLGHVGFLAEAEPGIDLDRTLTRLMEDDYLPESRMMLRVRVHRGGAVFKEYHCLNDCVVTKKLFEGLIHIDASVDDKPALSYNGDGLIVATPTGASGYSLSAGGPLVSPEMEAMILTPVSAHCLYCRSLVVDAEREILLRADREEGSCVLSIDGKTANLELEKGDEVRISKSDLKTVFIRMNDQSFFHVLSEKLRERQ